jgi:hypothetical protein
MVRKINGAPLRSHVPLTAGGRFPSKPKSAIAFPARKPEPLRNCNVNTLPSIRRAAGISLYLPMTYNPSRALRAVCRSDCFHRMTRDPLPFRFQQTLYVPRLKVLQILFPLFSLPFLVFQIARFTEGFPIRPVNRFPAGNLLETCDAFVSHSFCSFPVCLTAP